MLYFEREWKEEKYNYGSHEHVARTCYAISIFIEL